MYTIHYRDSILSSLDIYFMYRDEFAKTGNFFDYEEAQSWRMHLMILIDFFMKEINNSKEWKIYLEKKNNFSTLIEWFISEHFDFNFEW